MHSFKVYLSLVWPRTEVISSAAQDLLEKVVKEI